MTWEIDTAAKRARLPVRKNPYWRGIAGGRGGVSLGYRRRMNGPGAWIAKMIVDGNRFEERIGVEDDPSAPANAVGYRTAVSQALDWSLRQHSALEATGSVESTQRPTVRGAFKSYAKYRISRSERDGKNAEGRL